MSGSTSGNDYAFPSTDKQDDYVERCFGLTKREYFAAMAIQGLLANPNWSDSPAEDLATCAISQADWLMTALNK